MTSPLWRLSNGIFNFENLYITLDPSSTNTEAGFPRRHCIHFVNIKATAISDKQAYWSPTTQLLHGKTGGPYHHSLLDPGVFSRHPTCSQCSTVSRCNTRSCYVSSCWSIECEPACERSVAEYCRLVNEKSWSGCVAQSSVVCTFVCCRKKSINGLKPSKPSLLPFLRPSGGFRWPKLAVSKMLPFVVRKQGVHSSPITSFSTVEKSGE